MSQFLQLYFCSLEPDEGGGPHVAHNRQQRGRNSGEEHSLPDVGHWRPGVSEVLLEHLLLQHGGEGLLATLAAGVFVLSTDGSRGRPCQRSAFDKGASLKGRAGVSLCSAEQMCKSAATPLPQANVAHMWPLVRLDSWCGKPLEIFNLQVECEEDSFNPGAVKSAGQVKVLHYFDSPAAVDQRRRNVKSIMVSSCRGNLLERFPSSVLWIPQRL